MNCSIPGVNIKIITKALQTLSRIGDELHIEAKPKCLSFATLNLSKTTFVMFNFFEGFFSCYTIEENVSNTNPMCRMHIKTILGVFRNLKEKDVEFCSISFTLNSDNAMFKVKYKCNIVINHTLHLKDFEILTLNCDTDDKSNQICATGLFYGQIVSRFLLTDLDMYFDISKTKIIARNYDVDSKSMKSKVNTQVVMNSSEFGLYKINQESQMEFCLHTFRAAVFFAEAFNLNITLNWDVSGKPAIIKIQNPTFEASFIVSTINPADDGSTQTTTTCSIVSSRKENPNLTVQDKEALENMIWDDDEFSANNIQKTKDCGNAQQQTNDKRQTNDKQQTSDVQQTNDKQQTNDCGYVIPQSPESPRTKKLKVVFRRCWEKTVDLADLNSSKVLAPNSDSDGET